MAKVKLELRTKTDEELRDFAKNHKTQITGNPNFPTPEPSPAVYDAKLVAYTAKLEAVGTAEIALQTLRVERDALRAELELQLNGRGNYVDSKAEGDASKILSAGFEIVSAPTPTSSLPAPGNVRATMGTKPVEIVISGNAVPKAKSYIYECREHVEGAPPGAWSQVKVGPAVPIRQAA